MPRRRIGFPDTGFHDIAAPVFNAWEKDSIELFFDGDNSKNSEAMGYDSNDDQLRFIYNQFNAQSVRGNIDISAVDYGYSTTSDGWNLEVELPFSALPFDGTANHIFGFEAQVNDNDTGVRRSNVLKWWSDIDDSWKNPSLFGTAKLIEGFLLVDEIQFGSFTNGGIFQKEFKVQNSSSKDVTLNNCILGNPLFSLNTDLPLTISKVKNQ